MTTPRERQVAKAVADYDFHASARAMVNEMDEAVAERDGEPLFLRECRDCGFEFRTRTKNTGSKWTSLCPSCLQDEL